MAQRSSHRYGQKVGYKPSLLQRRIKKKKNTLPNVMGFDFKANLNWMTGLNQRHIPGSVRFFSIFFTLWESRKASDPSLPRIRSSPLGLLP
jgi:hypothetical protein